MKDFKGTRGEWKLEVNNFYPQIKHWKEVDGKTRATSISCFISDDSTGKFIDDSLCEENIANARLIEQAPKLLEEHIMDLKHLKSWRELLIESNLRGTIMFEEYEEMIEAKEKTINKALGNDNQ